MNLRAETVPSRVIRIVLALKSSLYKRFYRKIFIERHAYAVLDLTDNFIPDFKHELINVIRMNPGSKTPYYRKKINCGIPNHTAV
jgi:hypothetical protein